VITGVHALINTSQPEAARAFFRDVLGLPFVDSGHGWLIFGLPPAELGIHPGPDGGDHELYLMCDDIHATVEDLQGRGVEFTSPITDASFGLLTSIRIPGGELGLYQPGHPTATSLWGQQ